jgi:DNA (cytosine-5)-methyltransferase 1
VRNDLDREPAFPKPLPYRYTLGEAIRGTKLDLCRWLSEDSQTYLLWSHTKPGQSEGMKRTAQRLLGKKTMLQHYRLSMDKPANTLVQGSICLYHPDEPRSLSIAEAKRVCSFPDDFRLTGSFAQQWERLGRAVPPVMMYHIARIIREEVLTPCAG